MITFFATPRAFEGEFEVLQRLAIQSWMEAVPGCRIILMGKEKGIYEACEEFDLLYYPDLATNANGTPLFSDAFAVAERFSPSTEPSNLYCEISSDIVLSSEVQDVLYAIADVKRPFVVGQRTDIDPGAAPDTARLHPPSGVDYFIYRKNTLGKIPPFAVGRTAYDNWIIWAALKLWDMTVIDATHDLFAVHVNHGYPKWEGGKPEMLQGLERQENLSLAWETGCDRWYSIHDAPFVLVNGVIKERENEHLDNG